MLPVTVVTVPALPATGQTSINVSPTAPIAEGANCVLTVVAANVSDTDTDDPPNLMAADFTLTFAVDTAPAETLTETEVGGAFQDVTGAGATNVDLDSNVQVTFNEAVTVTFPANGLQCPAGNNIPVTVTTNNGTITINPTADLPGNTLCVVTVVAAQTTDTDMFDPPNQLDGNGDTVEGDNFSFGFTTQSVAVDDAYTITPHLTYNSGVAGLNVRDNDQPATVTVTGFGDALGTANGTVPDGTNFITAGGAGGRVVMNADGTFVYYPDAGDSAASGTATFFYTITGGDTA